MMDQHNNSLPIIKAASACVWRGDEVLLVQRGKASGYGLWAFPGGRVEPGETLLQAALRELSEETRIVADLTVKVGDFPIQSKDAHFMLTNFAGHYVSGVAIAASDAMAVRWVRMTELHQLPLAMHMLSAIDISRQLLKL
jgi:8-oxo-dGTP diphosphatase